MSTQINPKQRVLLVVFTILGCLLIVFFGLRVLHAFRKFGGPPPPPHARGEIETDVERIRNWMTVPFIARMYGVPEDLLFDALGISPEGNRKRSLEDLDELYFSQSSGFAKQLVKTAILAHQASGTPDLPHPPLSPLTPLPPTP